jgi:bisphosphoglycerate-dependent phosphoglycerate mutase
MNQNKLNEIKRAFDTINKPRKYTKRVVFIRHGESEGNVRNILYGATDYALTSKGINQAKFLSKVIKPRLAQFDNIVSSNLTRSLETCRNVVDLENPMICSNFNVMGLNYSKNSWALNFNEELMETGKQYNRANNFFRVKPVKNPSPDELNIEFKPNKENTENDVLNKEKYFNITKNNLSLT